VQIDSIAVLKFGSSVLRDEQDVAIAVHEIYRQLRDGRRVVAVVSALGKTTDRLLAQAQSLCGSPEPAGLAALLATGEATSAALLTLALDRAGIPAALLDPWRVGLRTEGPLLDAEPLELNRREIFRILEQKPVAVLSGFVGQDTEGRTSLLGRGGSDLTALFVAHRINAEACRLIKDVDGLYEADPAKSQTPRRYALISWDDAIGLGGRIVQPKAIQYAKRYGLSFEVSAPASPCCTMVGRGPTRLDEEEAERAPLRVTLLGLGTVGLGVYRHLTQRPDMFEVVGIAVRDVDKHRADGARPGLVSNDPFRVLAIPSDLVVEAIGGVEPASSLVAEAIKSGRDVVTANKAVIATHGPRLARLAESARAQLRFSATVGGGVPVVESVERVARLGPIHSVEGVLNATTTYVLDQIVAGSDFAGAVRSAQESGFAEADPSFDLNGTDAAHKLVIVARAAFGVVLDLSRLEYSGIDHLDPDEVREAHAAGSVVRLVASCRRTPEGAIEAHVRPVKLPAYHPLAQPRNEENRVLVQPAFGPPTVVDGKGAGRWPTAESVLADILDIYRFRRAHPAQHLMDAVAAGPAWEPGIPMGAAPAARTSLGV
jgi:homoserine dehydrogenase